MKGKTIMELNLTDLKKELREETLRQVYLFYGKEQYLLEYYTKKIMDAVPDGGMPEFNRMVVEDNRTTPAELEDFIETYPLMSEKKLLVLQNTGLFKEAKAEIKEFWSEKLSNLPDYIVLLVTESEVDKRSVLYKALSKVGCVLEFALLSQADVVTWIIRQALDEKKKITKENAAYLAEICDEGLSAVRNELNKLISYCGEEILKSDIERVVSKSLQVRIFELTDSMTAKDADLAFRILGDLKNSKESAFRILYVLSNTFDQLLHTKLLLAEGASAGEISGKLKVAPFIAKKLSGNVRGFSEEFLKNRIMQTAQIDLAIKEGKISEWAAIEEYIADSFRLLQA